MTEKRDVTDSPPAEANQRASPESNPPSSPGETRTHEPAGERGEADDAESEETDGDPLVPEPMSTPVLAGQIEREHAAFVVLGALATVAVFLQLSGIWL